MQIKAIPGPVEALLSPFGSAGFFVADSAEVASGTHDVDFVANGSGTVPAASVWVAVPFGREVLVAAAMLNNGMDAYDLAVITDDQVREWALGTVLYVGTERASREIDTTAYQSGYRSTDPDRVRFFRMVCARIDAAFGFTADAETCSDSARISPSVAIRREPICR